MRTRLLTTAIAGFALAALLGVLLPSDTAVHAQNPPVFDDTDVRSVDENTPPGVNIGAPISATDPDEDTEEFGNTLTYKLGGTDAASFDIDPSTGQLITKAPLDHEADDSYSVMVTVTDSETPANTVERTVTINVTDVNELPAQLPPPTVVSGEDPDLTDTVELSTTTLKVVWHPPVNTGRENITGYDVQYKKTTGTTFFSGDDPNTTATEVVTVDVANTTATITELSADTSYQVRVRATNNDLQANNGPWSLVGVGSTNKEGNSPPQFTQSPPQQLNMDENSQPGRNVGGPVTADDADSRTLGYEFDGRDAGLFDFNTSTGQIRTKSGVTYNHEDPACGYADTVIPTACTYYVTVVASDGAGGSDALRVRISVADRTETPSAPAQPAVRPTENSRTSLEVSWSEPANTGPAITSYAVEYRLKGSSDSFSTNGVPDDGDAQTPEGTVTGTSTTISGVDSTDAPWLTPGMSYEVRVRATTDEGTSGWSPVGTGTPTRATGSPCFVTGTSMKPRFRILPPLQESWMRTPRPAGLSAGPSRPTTATATSGPTSWSLRLRMMQRAKRLRPSSISTRTLVRY